MKYLSMIIAAFLLISCSGGRENTQKSERGGETEINSTKSMVPVEVKQIAPESFSRYFEVTGTMEAILDAHISPEVNGQIQQVLVNRGERVKRGDLLVKLNTDVTEKSIDEVKTNLELATRIFEKQEDLWAQQIGSELQYLEAKNNMESLEARLATLEKQLELAQITAPFPGIVEDIPVKRGELASPGMRLVHLVNLDRMRVMAEVSEAYLNRVNEGDLIELRFSSYPDMVIKEKVSRLGQVINPQTRTFTLEIEIPNQAEKLKPNMLTTVRIRDFESDEAMVVPSIILKEDFNGTFLFIISGGEGEQMARKVYVERGITVQDRTMITGGINTGDLVVTSGYNLIGDQSPVRISNL